MDMNIPLGTDIIDLVAVLCFSTRRRGQKGFWNRVIKLHLLNPETDGIKMLKRLRPFILKLHTIDANSNIQTSKSILGKVCKSFHNVIRNINLSVKIKSDNLVDTTASALFHDVIEK